MLPPYLQITEHYFHINTYLNHISRDALQENKLLTSNLCRFLVNFHRDPHEKSYHIKYERDNRQQRVIASKTVGRHGQRALKAYWA